MSQTLGALVISAFAVVCLFQPWVTVALILVLGLVAPFVPGFEELRGLSLVAIAGMLGSLRYVFGGGLRGWPLLWPVAFGVVFFLNLATSPFGDWNFAQLAGGAFCTYYLTCYAIRSRNQASMIAYAAILVGIFAATVSFADLRLGIHYLNPVDPLYAERAHGAERSLVASPNYLFPFVLPGLFFALLLYFTRASKAAKALMLSAVAVMVVGSLATLSRGTAVAVGVIFLVLLVSRSERSILRWGLAVVPFLAAGIVLYYAFPELFGLLVERFQEVQQEGAGERGYLFDIGLQQFSQSPLWGVGIGTTAATGRHAVHDGYFGLLGEAGLIGLVLFYSMPLVWVVQVEWARQQAARLRALGIPGRVFDLLRAFLIGCLVYSLFNTIVYLKPVLLLMAVTQLYLTAFQGRKAPSAQAMVALVSPVRPRGP